MAFLSPGTKKVAAVDTHVQYTQTDTIRQTDGPSVPMVRLVPIENDVIPVVGECASH